MYDLKERCSMCKEITNVKKTKFVENGVCIDGVYICENCDKFIEKLLNEDCEIGDD